MTAEKIQAFNEKHGYKPGNLNELVPAINRVNGKENVFSRRALLNKRIKNEGWTFANDEDVTPAKAVSRETLTREAAAQLSKGELNTLAKSKGIPSPTKKTAEEILNLIYAS